ncbi:hypothetical protein [Limnohabitans sp. Bal53]|uniref:hypothetical protein n=1 Tax=Limnohabitans sp. Bal53 TaxID=1977910 RepID=UPI000D3B3007|nr:hypothetical protein [Limnohabitans sp. Bal53]PUE40186.1 hypothetical protein B9Z50_12040 [Limnohabitans sp. Bal53]
MEEMTKRIAHLGFIQAIITRMGTNSFLLKGWSVTLVAAMFALAVKDADKSFMLLAYFPVFVFWWLDGFFLYTEKLYRCLYEKVASGEISSDRFILDTSIVRDDAPNILSVLFSKTLLTFHIVVVGVVLMAMYVLAM